VSFYLCDSNAHEFYFTPQEAKDDMNKRANLPPSSNAGEPRAWGESHTEAQSLLHKISEML
jgi:hypothetical protein